MISERMSCEESAIFFGNLAFIPHHSTFPHIICDIYHFLMLFVGKQKTLYMSNVKSIEEATRPNLKKSLRELGLESGCEVIVADVTTPQPLTFKLIFD